MCKHKVVTLNPALMHKMHQRILDLSNITKANCLFGHSRSALCYLSNGEHYTAFPDGARGVLHYYVDPSLPPISGSLRFRLCNILEEFERGSDLQGKPGRPWFISLCRLVRTQSYQPICKTLLDEGHIDQRLLTNIQDLNLVSRIIDDVLLYDLKQPVISSLQHRFFTPQLVTSRSSSVVKLGCLLFYDQSLKCAPFQGNVDSARSVSPLF